MNKKNLFLFFIVSVLFGKHVRAMDRSTFSFKVSSGHARETKRKRPRLSKLHQALFEFDRRLPAESLERVKRACRVAGSYINVRFPESMGDCAGLTPLQVALVGDFSNPKLNLSLVKILCRVGGIDINKRFPASQCWYAYFTPLMFSLVRQPENLQLTVDLARVLCRVKGINVNVRCVRPTKWYHRCTPLQFVVRSGDFNKDGRKRVALVGILCRVKSIDPNVVYPVRGFFFDGYTPLQYMLFTDHECYDAKVSFKKDEGDSNETVRTHIVKLLCRLSSLDIGKKVRCSGSPYDRFDAMQIAVKHERIGCLDMLSNRIMRAASRGARAGGDAPVADEAEEEGEGVRHKKKGGRGD